MPRFAVRAGKSSSRNKGLIPNPSPGPGDAARTGEGLTSRDGIAQLIRDFASARKPGTLRAYAFDLTDFARRMGFDDAIDAIRVLLANGPVAANQLAHRFRGQLVDAGLASATVNRRLSSLRSFSSWLAWIGITQWQLRVLPVASRPYRDTRGPGVVGVRSMLNTVVDYPNQVKAVRDSSILWLLSSCAMRVGEVHDLDISHLDESKSTLMILGKGQRERQSVSIPAPAMMALKQWLSIRGRGAGPLFWRLDRQHEGRPLTTRGIQYLVTKHGANCGLRVHPHSLRHSSVTRALDMGLPIRSVQRYARHASLQTLSVYDDNRLDLGGQVAAEVAADLQKSTG